MARPTKLTAQVQATICEALREGASLVDACHRAGVPPSTFFEWLARGRGHDRRRPATQLYVNLVTAVDALTDREPLHPPAETDEPTGFAESAASGFPDASRKRARAREEERAQGNEAAADRESRGGYVWESQRTRDSRDLLSGLADYEF